MKNIFTLLSIVFFSHDTIYAQSNFFNTYDLDNSSSDIGWDIIVDESGFYMATGSLCPPEFTSCFGLYKIDLSGEVAWKKITPGYRQGGQNCLIKSQDGSLFAAGDRYIGEDDYEVFLMKINAITGETIWVKYYNSYAANFARTLRELPNGDLVIFSDGDTAFTSHPNLSLIKTDHEGNVIWHYDYPDTYRLNQSGDMEIFPDGSIFTVSKANTWYNYDDYLVMNKFSSEGELLWTKESFKLTFDTPKINPLPNGNMGIFIRVDTFNYEIIGIGGYGPTALIGAIDSAGEFVWYELLSMEVQNELEDITTASNGDMIAVGTKEETTVWDDPLAWIVRYTQNGDQVFDKIYYFPDFDSMQYYQPHFIDIVELPDERIAVCGFVRVNSNPDAFIFTTDAYGCYEEHCSYNISTATEDIAAWETDLKFEVFPNPADASTTLYISDIPVRSDKVEVFTATGIKVREITKYSQDQELDTSAFPDGLYFIQLRADGRIIATSRLVVQH